MARSLVFGTAGGGTFREKVDSLCRELCEGEGFHNLDVRAPVMATDDKLDVVAWVPFVDTLPGQLILFAQCKTGTNWQDSVTQLQPDVFIDRWIAGHILVTPVRAFCLSESTDRTKWSSTCRAAGIFLDRCRLVACCDNVDTLLLWKIKLWTDAAIATVNL
jgi:hypothetical protein